jgi:O-antigen/teichoic acid export membrane protein
VRGVAVLAFRTVLLQILTVEATIALARLLSPQDYGLFAIGFAVQQFTRIAVDFGLPVPLVRRQEAPSVGELRALTGLVLLLGLTIAGAAAVLAYVVLPATGTESLIAKVVAITCIATPFYGLRLGSMIGLERGLRFGRIALVDTAETIGYYAFAVPAAAAGLGAYSLAGGMAVAVALSSLTALVLSPWSFGLSHRFGLLRPTAALSISAGLFYPVGLVREAGLAGILTGISGTTLTGYYSFAQRIFTLPSALIVVLQKVGLPALSQTEAGALRIRRAAQAAAVSAVVAGLPLAALVGSLRPVIAEVFGRRWLPAADIALYATPGMIVGCGAWIVLTGLFLADGRGRPPLEAMVVNLLVTLACAAILTGPLGGIGVGIALSAGPIAGTAVLLLRTRPDAAAFIGPTVRALASTSLAIAAARLAARGTGISDLAIALAVAIGTWAAASLILNRPELPLLLRLARSARHPVPKPRPVS